MVQQAGPGRSTASISLRTRAVSSRDRIRSQLDREATLAAKRGRRERRQIATAEVHVGRRLPSRASGPRSSGSGQAAPMPPRSHSHGCQPDYRVRSGGVVNVARRRASRRLPRHDPPCEAVRAARRVVRDGGQRVWCSVDPQPGAGLPGTAAAIMPIALRLCGSAGLSSSVTLVCATSSRTSTSGSPTVRAAGVRQIEDRRVTPALLRARHCRPASLSASTRHPPRECRQGGAIVAPGRAASVRRSGVNRRPLAPPNPAAISRQRHFDRAVFCTIVHRSLSGYIWGCTGTPRSGRERTLPYAARGARVRPSEGTVCGAGRRVARVDPPPAGTRASRHQDWRYDQRVERCLRLGTPKPRARTSKPAGRTSPPCRGARRLDARLPAVSDVDTHSTRPCASSRS